MEILTILIPIMGIFGAFWGYKMGAEDGYFTGYEKAREDALKRAKEFLNN